VLLCPGITGYAWPREPDVDAEFDAAAAEGIEALAEVGLRLWAAAGRTPEAVEQLRVPDLVLKTIADTLARA
jgi:hypothetical protein